MTSYSIYHGAKQAFEKTESITKWDLTFVFIVYLWIIQAIILMLPKKLIYYDKLQVSSY